MNEKKYDVVVIGCGNAALCSALSARDGGASVLVLEKAPEPWRGGNSAFSGGLFRFAFQGMDDIYELVPDLSDEEKENIEIEPYTHEKFFDDLARVTEYQTDGDLASTMIDQSLPTLKWMQSKGLRLVLAGGRQAFKVDGKLRFWGGLILEIVGGGWGLIDALLEAASNADVEIRYESKATKLITDSNGRVTGVSVRGPEGSYDVHASSVVLASGGFEANSEMRCRYLGPGWELAKVRGTPYNTGDGIKMALDIGAQPYGHWSGCHSVAWDLNAPAFGDLTVGESFQKHSYPFAVVVNINGERFLDEGADFRNYTYAKYGGLIMEQPQRTAYQIFDQKTLHLMRDEYRIRDVTKTEANTLEELAEKLEINVENFVKTIKEFNSSIEPVKFDPTVKDGKCTKGITPPKSNWAQPIDEPPYEAYSVTTGITFTFGGIRVNNKAEVINTENNIIPGLFAAGELVGGVYYFNYPGGAGLTLGAVYGRLAGIAASANAKAES